MSMTIHVNVVSAEQSIYSGTATMVFAPAIEGEVGISPRHAPLLTGLGPGEVRVLIEGGQEEHFFISGGMLEVLPHVVTILADTAQRAADIDEAAAREAKEKAERLMADSSAKMEYAKARAQLAEAAAQLRTLDRLRKKRATH
jgi:F-type H+-transporting ATPase subunit epsilon